jgi:hypothetical protein
MYAISWFIDPYVFAHDIVYIDPYVFAHDIVYKDAYVFAHDIVYIVVFHTALHIA